MINVGIFIFNGIELLDFAGPYEVFSVAADYQEGLSVFTISEDGKMISSVNGLKVVPDFGFDDHPKVDILIIPGGNGTKVEMKKHTVLKWIRECNELSQITMSICSGTRLLGTLGLLDNLEYTTHHEVEPHMRQIAPQANYNGNKRFVDNGKIMTSGGISAGIDLSLYVIGKLFGNELVEKTKAYLEYGDWKKIK